MGKWESLVVGVEVGLWRGVGNGKNSRKSDGVRGLWLKCDCSSIWVAD